uniref:Uncharacterized protein n=1 Tax=Arundo donax TaxID=35708 RepID=A0A0A9BUW6_ARUDO
MSTYWTNKYLPMLILTTRTQPISNCFFKGNTKLIKHVLSRRF